MIRFPCPRCRAALKVPDARAGQQVTCPECARVVPVLEPDDAPSAELDDDAPGPRRFPGWAWAAGAAGALALALVVALAVRGGRSAPPDADAILGQWELVSGAGAENGVRFEYPRDRGPQGTVYFRFDRGRLKTNKDTAAFELDPSKRPKWITVTFDGAGPKDRFADGIYELNGDDLKICWVPGGKASRPTTFADFGRDGFTMVFRRVR